MSEKDIEETVRQVVCERLGRKPEEVTADARFVEDLRADLLEVAELLMGLQEEFNIVIGDDAAQLKTVGDAIRYVESRIYE